MLQLQVRLLIAFTDARNGLVARVRLRDEDGMTTETVIITAVLAALAIAVGLIITTKVTQKAESIPTQ